MPERKAIRLLAPVRSGKEVIPNNAVLDADLAVADDLIGRGLAEATDALERYPNVPFLDKVDEGPVWAGDRFPLPPDSRLLIPPALPRTEAERDAERAARAQGPIRVEAPPPAPERPTPAGEAR